jgi:predicted RNase H-like nuclease
VTSVIGEEEVKQGMSFLEKVALMIEGYEGDLEGVRREIEGMKMVREFVKVEKKVRNMTKKVIESDEFGKRAREVVVEMIGKGMEFNKRVETNKMEKIVINERKLIDDEKKVNIRDENLQKKIFENVLKKNLSEFYEQTAQDDTLLSQGKSLIT